ncbi:hypothetical protein GCM10011332_07120 [Terasakiella brassicae]|uniref:Flagellar assembly protein FliH/Type III secretion system HrpE domain-containing protein n=1 Tax=Terasakiella brassicae TaxID=1634917 RepID=A0A917F8T9_9PROT|nr:FliH/SctL family protein [Terasakiella brassicae]GGF56219.1 hypothetical protein GCM10011332_07120 [Terasakiella brassicae]
MSTVKRYMFENRNFDPDYDPEADHSYAFDDDDEAPHHHREREQDEGDDDEEVEAPPPPTFSEEEVLAAQQTAFDEGKAAGLEEANAQFERMIATALTQMAQTIPAVFAAHSKSQEDHEAHALSVANAVTKKIIPAYAEKHGLDEILNVVSKCLEPLRAEPRIIVKVHESLREDLHDKLVKIADELGFDGRIVTMAHDDILPGDCRIEWAEGGAERNIENMWQLIDEIVERNLTQGTNQGETHNQADAPLSNAQDVSAENRSENQTGIEETSFDG